jgi:hypothetical protein
MGSERSPLVWGVSAETTSAQVVGWYGRKSIVNQQRIIFFRKLISAFGNIISLLIISCLIFIALRFARTSYQYWFFTKPQPLSIMLTDFSKLTAKSGDSCDEYNQFSPPVKIYISRLASNMYKTDFNFESSGELDYYVDFPAGEITIQYTYLDGTKKASTSSGENAYQGSATRIEVVYNDVNYFEMEQYFCETLINLYDPSIYTFNVLESSDMKFAGVKQFLPQGSKIRVIISDPKNLDDKNVKAIEVTYSSDYDRAPFYLFSKSTGLSATLPSINNFLPAEGFEALYIRTDEIQIIERPVGSLKFGNSPIRELVKVSSLAKDTLKVPSMYPNDYNETYSIIWYKNRGTQISGTANSVILNGEELGKAPWYSLPDYVQAGLFGLLISLVGGIWAYRKPLLKRIASSVPYWDLLDPSSPLKGSYVFITNSGIIVAGELSRKPSKNYPYYLIKNARRKANPSSDWEKELISEIRIRADAVEQSYVL